MGELAAVVSDPADIREIRCRLPDDVPASTLAARLAAAAHFPVNGPDNAPLNYGFIVTGGCILDPASTLAEIGHREPLRLRLVPELAIGSEEQAAGGNPELPFGPELGQVTIDEEHCLMHDDGLDLPLEVRLDASAHLEIEQFAARDRYAECAGLLLGEVTVERKARVAGIRAIAPAVGAVESRTSVRITFEAWEAMLAVRDRDYAGLRVLGWFHTHAGWGVFLSEMDLFVHKFFFPHPSMVAFVLDPTSGHESFFGWRDGNVVQLPNYGLVGALKKTGGARLSRRRLALVGCAAGVAVAAGLYFGLGSPRDAPEPKPAQARATVRREQPKAERLYVIGKRDNLWLICNRVYHDGDLAPALAKYNGVSSYTGLQVGQQIKLPPKDVLRKR